MKLLCIEDVVTNDTETNENKEYFSKHKVYNSRLFRSGMELYAIDNFESMHMVASGSNKEDTLSDWWLHKYFKIIDESSEW